MKGTKKESKSCWSKLSWRLTLLKSCWIPSKLFSMTKSNKAVCTSSNQALPVFTYTTSTSRSSRPRAWSTLAVRNLIPWNSRLASCNPMTVSTWSAVSNQALIPQSFYCFLFAKQSIITSTLSTRLPWKHRDVAFHSLLLETGGFWPWVVLFSEIHLVLSFRHTIPCSTHGSNVKACWRQDKIAPQLFWAKDMSICYQELILALFEVTLCWSTIWILAPILSSLSRMEAHQLQEKFGKA